MLLWVALAIEVLESITNLAPMKDEGFAFGVSMFVVFGIGFGLMHPAYTAFVMSHVAFSRRAAAFGAMIAAFDTGIGTGSSVMGWLVHHVGYRPAFGLMAGVAALSLPSFLFAERRLGFGREGQRSEVKGQRSDDAHS